MTNEKEKKDKEGAFASFIKEAAIDIFRTTILPSVQDSVYDLISKATRAVIYKEKGSVRRVYNHERKNLVPENRVRYDRIYGRNHRRDRSSSSNKIDRVIFNSESEAIEVLDRMEEVLAHYGEVTVGVLYEAAGLEIKHTDDKYGWRSMREAKIHPYGDGFTIELPRPEFLD